MKSYAKYCLVEKDGKLMQMNLTEPSLSNSTIIERMITKGRRICPTIAGASIITLILGSTKFPILLEPSVMALSFFSVLTLTSYLNIFPTAKGYNAIARTKKVEKLLKQFYSQMREFENLKTKNNFSKILKKQEKLALNLVKKLEKIQRRNLNAMHPYTNKINSGKELGNLKQFAYDQIETARDSVDKFIFHNFSILNNLCPSKNKFLVKRTNAYLNNVLKSDKSFYDEYISDGTSDETFVKNDDILNRKSDYTYSLCKKLGYEDDDEDGKLTTVKTLNDEELKLEKQQIKENKNQTDSSDEFLF